MEEGRLLELSEKLNACKHLFKLAELDSSEFSLMLEKASTKVISERRYSKWQCFNNFRIFIKEAIISPAFAALLIVAICTFGFVWYYTVGNSVDSEVVTAQKVNDVLKIDKNTRLPVVNVSSMK